MEIINMMFHYETGFPDGLFLIMSKEYIESRINDSDIYNTSKSTVRPTVEVSRSNIMKP